MDMLEVHHVEDFKHHPELELVESNLIVLCECEKEKDHLGIGHTIDGKSDWKITNPNVREDAARKLAEKRKV